MKTLDEKIDVIITKVSNIETTVAVQGQILDEHQRRSLAAEENIALLRDELKPIQKHVYYVEAVFKAIGFCSTVLGIISLLIKLLF